MEESMKQITAACVISDRLRWGSSAPFYLHLIDQALAGGSDGLQERMTTVRENISALYGEYITYQEQQQPVAGVLAGVQRNEGGAPRTPLAYNGTMRGSPAMAASSSPGRIRSASRKQRNNEKADAADSPQSTKSKVVRVSRQGRKAARLLPEQVVGTRVIQSTSTAAAPVALRAGGKKRAIRRLEKAQLLWVQNGSLPYARMKRHLLLKFARIFSVKTASKLGTAYLAKVIYREEMRAETGELEDEASPSPSATEKTKQPPPFTPRSEGQITMVEQKRLQDMEEAKIFIKQYEDQEIEHLPRMVLYKFAKAYGVPHASKTSTDLLRDQIKEAVGKNSSTKTTNGVDKDTVESALQQDPQNSSEGTTNPSVDPQVLIHVMTTNGVDKDTVESALQQDPQSSSEGTTNPPVHPRVTVHVKSSLSSPVSGPSVGVVQPLHEMQQSQEQVRGKIRVHTMPVQAIGAQGESSRGNDGTQQTPGRISRVDEILRATEKGSPLEKRMSFGHGRIQVSRSPMTSAVSSSAQSNQNDDPA